MESRRGFMISQIADKAPFDEILERTEEKFPQKHFKQTHKNALSSILSQTGLTIPKAASLGSKREAERPTKQATRVAIKTNENRGGGPFFSRTDLIRSLSSFNAAPVIVNYRQRDLKNKTAEEILLFSVGNSIYRAFRYETPSIRYMRWRWHSTPEKLVARLNILTSQEEFDAFAISVGQDLVDDWGKNNDHGEPTRMNIGVAMKITNLVLKHLYFSDLLKNKQILNWLHVPWDSFTLKPLRSIWQGNPLIPANPSQGFVDNLWLYKELHGLISEIAKEANIPRIYYEIYAWDNAH